MVLFPVIFYFWLILDFLRFPPAGLEAHFFASSSDDRGVDGRRAVLSLASGQVGSVGQRGRAVDFTEKKNR